MAQIASPSRTPFGMLNETRLHQLTSVKNKQNALAGSPSVLSKRKHSSDPFASDLDSENVDPSLLSPKKTKLSSNGSLKSGLSQFSKPSHFILKTDNTASVLSQPPSISSRPIATPKKLSTRAILDTTPRTAPAGRSPRRKRNGLGGKRRTSAPFTRINPPSINLNDGNQASNLPFSIDAALSGSVPSYKAPTPKTAAWDASVTTLDSDPSRSSWFFDIHEDTPEEELGNLMEFSTQTLDISDEESQADKRQREMEERGKENIPPQLSGVEASGTSMVAPASRKDLMSDEPRTPLGELEAKEFYAEGCDESSFVIISEDGNEELAAAVATETAETAEFAKTAEVIATTEKLDHRSIAPLKADVSAMKQVEHDVEQEASPTETKGTNQDTWQELLARVDEQQMSIAAEDVVETLSPQIDATVPDQIPLPPSDDDVWAVEATSREEAPLFDIWESESAKEEAEELDALAA